MKASSAKAKGRALQDWTRDILKVLFSFTDDDVKCAVMGEGGEDVRLISENARGKFPYSIECKNRETFGTLYKYHEQAKSHSDREGLLIIKMNRKKPLVILDAEHFFERTSRWN
jgi:hypothetical protein|tara:strand:- start:701 stop:1042 length:342 start_codon:yes stop_codon:yes gene_type:complete